MSECLKMPSTMLAMYEISMSAHSFSYQLRHLQKSIFTKKLQNENIKRNLLSTDLQFGDQLWQWSKEGTINHNFKWLHQNIASTDHGCFRSHLRISVNNTQCNMFAEYPQFSILHRNICSKMDIGWYLRHKAASMYDTLQTFL